MLEKDFKKGSCFDDNGGDDDYVDDGFDRDSVFDDYC